MTTSHKEFVWGETKWVAFTTRLYIRSQKHVPLYSFMLHPHTLPPIWPPKKATNFHGRGDDQFRISRSAGAAIALRGVALDPSCKNHFFKQRSSRGLTAHGLCLTLSNLYAQAGHGTNNLAFVLSEILMLVVSKICWSRSSSPTSIATHYVSVSMAWEIFV